VNAILGALGILGRSLAALLAALLPRRRWAALPALPIERLAGLSGVLTLGAGFALGGIGFVRYATRAVRR
jgi:hypothetical protein